MVYLSRQDAGFCRISCASPKIQVANVAFNIEKMLDSIHALSDQVPQIILFPELSITGYSCGDLFYQDILLSNALSGLAQLSDASAEVNAVVVVGLPIQKNGKLYNTAAYLANGKILGIVPKSYLPTTQEYYEERWFTSGKDISSQITLFGDTIPFGTDLIFTADNMPQCKIGIEICEDLWSVTPPSGELAKAGATVILNPSASNELLSKSIYRHELVKQQSARCLVAYAYAGANTNESTTDIVFGGETLIYENGTLLDKNERFSFGSTHITADIDLQKLVHDRRKNTSFSATQTDKVFREIPFTLGNVARLVDDLKATAHIPPTPFVPRDKTQRSQHCEEIFSIQSAGLAKRLKHINKHRVLFGVSGGLDSTLAFLVAINTFKMLNLDPSGILAVTMPGFGTSSRTKNNAISLAQELGIALKTIPIEKSVRQHFEDIGHPEDLYDVTYENAQARERTQILMDIANQQDSMVVGTGDLSELALGWCTYNADQMSMYHVNAGVPKTLVRYLIEWCAETVYSGKISDILHDICDTPITPELLPLNEDGSLQQETEVSVGPYELHDFFLFCAIRYAMPPKKIVMMAGYAFGETYDTVTIIKWLRHFYWRFFSQQFKRSAMPDGPKVGSVALSPRGDWRMPSDASSKLWIAELEALENSMNA